MQIFVECGAEMEEEWDVALTHAKEEITKF